MEQLICKGEGGEIKRHPIYDHLCAGSVFMQLRDNNPDFPHHYLRYFVVAQIQLGDSAMRVVFVHYQDEIHGLVVYFVALQIY